MKTRIGRRLVVPLIGATAAIVLTLLSPVPAVADDSDCLMCHENIGKAFEATAHGHVRAFEVLSGETGCRTCHGDGADHMDSGGEPGTIQTLGDGEFRENVSDVCISCHRTGLMAFSTARGAAGAISISFISFTTVSFCRSTPMGISSGTTEGANDGFAVWG